MKIYLVGGCVRDKLLGIESKDHDWTVVGATPADMFKLGYQQVGKEFPVFIHPQTKEEYALARRETKSGTGYHGFSFDTENVTLEDDLWRRDITINAMAIDENNKLIDPFGGQNDLANKIIRHVSAHFEEDPLRVLRIARFAAKLNFSVHSTTIALMRQMVINGELRYLTPERINIEITKALSSDRPSIFFRVLQDCGALDAVFPELQQHFETSLLALDFISITSNKISVRFATLCYHFGNISGIDALKIFCSRIKCSREITQLSLKVCENYHLFADALVLNAEKILHLLTSLRAINNPEIFNDFLLCCQSIAQSVDQSIDPFVDPSVDPKLRLCKQKDFLQLLLCRIIHLPLKHLSMKYSDRALGEAIKKERILEIKKCQEMYIDSAEKAVSKINY
ncbi:MAG: multifunctional CCA tRNA nucleotidyl transferase/2'3'-cyclic phosphodiesterase/2'nucleotidase/phosphatase [Oligoflexia bacterium]|nr:multifunctional CCA tRNA nucleotidyl transferase/2'3'-cyclic phosphodiesterase/2'nucleotidase/phosphatase [Oligoflexia bacterium]